MTPSEVVEANDTKVWFSLVPVEMFKELIELTPVWKKSIGSKVEGVANLSPQLR